ncbi:hotdog domain-containing protein [Rhodococcus oxybenzonivorans]|uniref:PaaI family thioesterase n=1 Tax=Rhodococcus oxybenzonivorans TaxID=1990687 RepID=UPI002952A1C2|nr:hotdog domain-containing protein [Rhodococcus oxybenzonivorans]MDV7355285.1 hotdog domain-containing protein [Rhodococcus oxybenzonivorans]
MRPDRGGQQYASLVESLRELVDTVAGIEATHSELVRATVAVSAISAELRDHVVPGDHQIAGTRLDLPGRGHPGVVPYIPTSWNVDRMTARVRFGRTYLGDRAAVHGGALSLLFDEILGRFANHGREGARTARLQVDYRQVVPLDRDLDVEAWVSDQRGRKLTIAGRLANGGHTLAEAEALFVVLHKGQP